MNRYYRTEVRRSWRGSGLIIAILVLSFIGPLISSLLRSSVEAFLAANSRRALTADIAITAYRPVRDDEVDRIRSTYGVKREVREVEFVTMTVGSDQASALIEVHGVEKGFPILGEFEFSDGTKLRETPHGSNIWLSDDAITTLGLSAGDTLRLGQSSFTIERVVKLAPGVSRAGFGFAPRAYIAIEAASPTGLLGFGSQVYHRLYLETKQPVISTDAVREALADPDLFLRTPEDSVQGVERFTGFVSVYLAVVSVSLFALGWAAAFYVIRTQAIERMRSTAISLVFGAKVRDALRFEFQRIAMLTVIAAALAFVFAYGGARLIEPFVAKALAENVAGVFQVAVSWKDIAALFATALASALIFTLPFASRLTTSKLNDLFQDSPLNAGAVITSDDSPHGMRPLLARFANALTAGFAIVTLSALSVWLTRDMKFGLQLALGFTLAAGLIHVAGVVVFQSLARGFARAHGRFGSLLRLVGTQLSRARFAVRLSFLAIGLSTFVASAVGQIMVSLGDELREGTKLDTAPDFFLFNIPESELENLKAALANLGTKLDFESPMILARLQSKNGSAITNETTNEQFQKFPVRITWREKNIGSERITEGEPLREKFDPARDVVPEISVEARFADRNGFKIGDRLMFDVQGVPIEGRIANLRRVRWTDFNPNFFISFQGGVLEDAPKTWLGNVRVTRREDRARVQSQIVRAFPDLSILDVGQTLERLVGILRAILGPAEQAAWLAMIFSVFVLLTIVGHSIRLRSREMNLFRILGTEPRRVKSLYRLEFALAAGLGSLVGAAGGLALAWWVSVRFLELGFRADVPRFAATLLGGLILGLGLGEWLFSRVSRGLGIDQRVV